MANKYQDIEFSQNILDLDEVYIFNWVVKTSFFNNYFPKILENDLGKRPEINDIRKYTVKGIKLFCKEEKYKNYTKEIFSEAELKEIKKINLEKLNGYEKSQLSSLNKKCEKLNRKFFQIIELAWYREYLKTYQDAAYKYINIGGIKLQEACDHIVKSHQVNIQRKNKINDEEYRDISQEAIAATTKAILEKRLNDPNNVYSYYIRTCNNLSTQKYKKEVKAQKGKQKILDIIEEAKHSTEHDYILQEVIGNRNEMLSKALKAAGQNCQSILLGLADKKSAKDLAIELGMTTNSIHARATQCRRKLSSLLLNHIGQSCKKALTIYKLHKRFERKAEEEAILIKKIQHELSLSSIDEAEEIVTTCMLKLYRLIYPNNF